MNEAAGKAARYMGFAEECMQLIDRMPQDAQFLATMAEAWLELAYSELKRQPAAENAEPLAPDLVGRRSIGQGRRLKSKRIPTLKPSANWSNTWTAQTFCFGKGRRL